MRTVRDASGKLYLLVEESGGTCRVRDPDTGEERTLDTDEYEAVGEEPPLATAAQGIPDPVRRAVTAVHDDRTLGLLVELVERGPLSVRTLLSTYDLCESDLHGLLGEFRAAGLVDETRVNGERGYEPTGAAREAVARLREE